MSVDNEKISLLDLLRLIPKWIWSRIFKAAAASRELHVEDVARIEKYNGHWHCVVSRGGFTVRQRLPAHVIHMAPSRAKFHLDQISERLCKKLDRMLPRGE